MQAAPRPLDDEERLSVLENYRLLDTPAEEIYDDIVALAAGIAGVPVALISLVDRDRQWFKARHGIDVAETERRISFCAWSVSDKQSLIVDDAHADARFAGNPLTDGPEGFRFYTGIPLLAAEGHVLGILCVLGHEPKKISPEQVAQLERLARLTMAHFESRRVADELAAALERVRTLAELVPLCAYCRRIRDDDAFWHTLEQYLESEVGTQVTHGICPDCAVKHFSELY